MGDVVHKTLPASECHEAPQILTAIPTDAGKVITPSKTLSGVGELRNLEYKEIDYPGSRQLGLSTSTIYVEAVGKPVLVLGPGPSQLVTVLLGNPATARIRRVTVIYGDSLGGELRIQSPAGNIFGSPYMWLKRPYEAATFETDGTSWYMVATNVNASGYQWVRDGQYTQASPRAVASGVRTKLTIDNVPTGQENYKDARYDLFDQANGRILFTKPGDMMSIRIAVRAKMAGASGYFDLETSFPSPVTGTNVTTEVMAKGGGTENRFIRQYDFFIDEYAMTQGYMELWVTPSTNMDFWGLTLLLSVQSASFLGGNE